MTIYSIYKFTNTVNSKVYIGLTTQTPEERYDDHRYASKTKSTYLYKAMRKYGFDNFKFEVIFSVITNTDDLRQFEIDFIKEYDCCMLDGRQKGYNMTRGGQFMDSETASYYNQKRLDAGTHIFQTPEFKKLREDMHATKIKNGTHNFQGAVQSARAIKQNTEQHICPHCSKIGKGRVMFRCHFDKCKIKLMSEGTWIKPVPIERTCPHCMVTGTGLNMFKFHFNNCKRKLIDPT